jgi:phospholipid/cholesterol/gamma-HCH transport system ATP-binding protein
MMERDVADIKEKIISVKNLHKSFSGASVLCGVNLDVYKGENVVVLGRSGSGKSVLIKLISGLIKQDAGEVNVLGKQIESLSAKELQNLRLRIGFSFQGSALYDGMSVKENLEFPLVRNKKKISRKEVNDAVEQELHDVGLLQTINQMPSELSGGQKKRIGIARTLILKPDIMLYDEPTGGIDPITCVEMNHLINKVQQQYNTSSIIITHDLTCAKTTGNRIAMLVDGKIEKEGSFDDVFDSDDMRIKGFYNYNFITSQ